MPTNPKLDFYRFKLNHKRNEEKTFKDFVIEELKANKNVINEKVVEVCFKHFINSLSSDFAKDDKLKKKLSLEKKKSINIHIDKQPTFNSKSDIIHGVINGGPYGRERIISNNDDEDDSEKLGLNKSVFLYFYFLLYVPSDHNEGCFIIHSNNSEETITILFRNYISNIFKGNNYNKAALESFCPKSFQDEFKKGAILKSMTFKSSFIETVPSNDPIFDLFQSYDIKIEAIPKNKNILASEAGKIKDFMTKKLFGSKNHQKQLGEFDETRFSTENENSNSTKTFKWNTKDKEFVPVVYLENRISKKNNDGTPDFEELHKLCLNLFNDEILKEIRPDLNARKVK